MRAISRALLTVIAVTSALGFLLEPARAQCSSARQFAMVVGMPKLKIDPQGAENLGNEIGRLWNSNNSSAGNTFGGLCDSQGTSDLPPWWRFSGAPLRGIRG